MPRARKTGPAPPGRQSADLNGPVGEVLTLAEAAAYLRLPETEVISLVQTQGLPGRRTDSDWRFLKAAIQDWLRATPPPQGGKEGWLAMAGAFKDDPDLEAIVEEAYRRRGRPITEGGSYKNFDR